MKITFLAPPLKNEVSKPWTLSVTIYDVYSFIMSSFRWLPEKKDRHS